MIDGSGSGRGIYMSGRSWNTVKNCVVTDFGYGLHLSSSSNNTLTDNTANSNSNYGVYLYSSNDNTLTGNTANSNSSYGIYLWSSYSNTLSGSTIRDNGGTGLHSVAGSNNLIYNNYFDNAQNAYASGTNTWNIAKTPGSNIIGGPYLGGNYWSDYLGVDTDGDGLGDTDLPYSSNGNIQSGGDYLPLVHVSGAVGGVAELPPLKPGAAIGDSGWPVPNTAVLLAGAAAGGLLLLTTGAWYARRRWLG